MKKLIAEVLERPDGSSRAVLYCVDEDGRPDQAVGNTLLEFLELSYPSATEVEQLLVLAESGSYVPKNPEWADWGVNDVDLWLRPPMADPGHICISNDNCTEYSSQEGGQPQQFSYKQFRVALKHWRDFRELLAGEGKESLVGRRYETVFPE